MNLQRALADQRESSIDALLATPQTALDAMPTAVYVCGLDGTLLRYNCRAAELWGRQPKLQDRAERFCGSSRLFLPDGTPLAHEKSPMAGALATGEPVRDSEIVMERPDRTRITALVSIGILRDAQGRVSGALNTFQDISAQKRLQDELRHSQHQLEDFFENGAVSLHLVGKDGTILRANQAELNLLGYSAPEYVGRNIAEFHADPATIADILRRLSAGEKLDKYPARLRAKDGSIKHVLITSSVRVHNGEFLNTRCFSIDVTQQHLADEALRENQQRLAATYQNANVGIAETDEHGRYVRVNDALVNITGYSREELLARNFMDITHPEDAWRDFANYKLQVRGEIERYRLQKRYIRKDGETVFIDLLSSTVHDSNGKFRYGVRVILDITERRRAEELLRDSERRWRELLEAIPAAVYTTDAEGRITFFNRAAVELSGRTPELGNDKWCVTWKLYRAEGTFLPHEECPMAVALREKRPIRGAEAIAERPDGTRVPFIPFPTPLFDAAGRCVGAINMLVDISERKRSEERQRVLIEELNHRVKNTLATVQSMASQTARNVITVEEFMDRFEARLLALSQTHNLLTASQWTGADLTQVLAQQLEPFGIGENSRVRLEGESVQLDARTALAVGMIFHELTTNAAKYGALSVATGKIEVSWSQTTQDDGSVLVILWAENGGPAVQPPKRKGFGTRLLERTVQGELCGSATLSFEESGFRCRIEIPRSELNRESIFG